jgi:hypothetical protein
MAWGLLWGTEGLSEAWGDLAFASNFGGLGGNRGTSLGVQQRCSDVAPGLAVMSRSAAT